MATRSVGVGAGWRWLVNAANLGGANPGAIFGGAALVLAVVFAVALVASLAMGMVIGVAGGGADPSAAATTSMVLSFVVTLPILFIMACLLVGYLRVIDAVERGAPASATGVFEGFRDMGTSLRAFGFIVLLAVAQQLVMVGLVKLLAPDLAALYMQMLQAAPGAPPPDMSAMPSGSGVAVLAILLFWLFAYALQSIGLGEIAIARSGIGAAVGNGASGAIRNLMPLLLLLLIAILAAIVLVVAAFLLVLLIGLLAKAVGMWIGFVIGVPLYLALVLVMLVIGTGLMYFMWRDIAGDGRRPAAADDAGDRVEI